MKGEFRQGIDPFNTDAGGGEGYQYTTAGQYSTEHVLARHLELILAMAKLEGRSVIDVGCGDGFSTFRFWDRAHPARLAGVDPAENAIAVANRKRGDRPIEFRVLGERVPFDDASFDVAIVQGVLHHADDPQHTIREALRVAREVVILEPNGLNPGLKLLEKVSPYHREHNERSYSRRRLRGWIEAAGGRVVQEKFAVFVPIFSPSWLARAMAAVEPLVEATPGVRAVSCSVQVIRATH
ncbi:MAG TPA: class I SAM-dependent methyltransferase [Candidatus Dormibacteraeota bacterium]